MKLRAKFSMSGFDTKGLTNTVKQEFKEVVFDSCIRIEAQAKQGCPVDKGELRADIKTRFTDDGLMGHVGTNVAHGPFVEFGTGQRGAASAVTIPDGVEYSYGQKPGMAAHPFLFPAFEAERPQFEKNAQGVLGKRR